MSAETYGKIATELEAMLLVPVFNPTREECEKVAEMRDKLKAMNAAELGISEEELEGAIGLAELRFRELVRAKR